MDFSHHYSEEYTSQVSGFILDQGVLLQRVAHIGAYVIAVTKGDYGTKLSRTSDGRAVLTKHSAAKILGVSPETAYRTLSYMTEHALLPRPPRHSGRMAFYLASLEDGLSALSHVVRIEHFSALDVLALARSLKASAVTRGGGK